MYVREREADEVAESATGVEVRTEGDRRLRVLVSALMLCAGADS